MKNNKVVIADIYTNLLRNSVAHHFTPHHTITSSYRYSRKCITKSYSMIDEVEVPNIFRELGRGYKSVL